MSTSVSKLRVRVGRSSADDLLRDARALPIVLLTMLRSMVDAWPDEVYAERIVETKLLGQWPAS